MREADAREEFIVIFRILAVELAKTHMWISAEDVQSIIRKFNEDEMKQLEDGVQDAFNRHDWSDVIEHRTYISYHHIIRLLLIITSEHWLRAPSVLFLHFFPDSLHRTYF